MGARTVGHDSVGRTAGRNQDPGDAAATRLHADQVEIDGEVAGNCRRAAAGARWPPAADVSGGTDNAVFRIGDDLAVRMPLDPRAVDGLRKEIRWLPVVAPHVSLEHS